MATFNIDVTQDALNRMDSNNFKMKYGFKVYPLIQEYGGCRYSVQMVNMAVYGGPSYNPERGFFYSVLDTATSYSQSTIGRYDTSLSTSFVGSCFEFYGVFTATGTFKVIVDNDIYYINIKNARAKDSNTYYKIFRIDNLPYTKHEVTISFIDVNDALCTYATNTFFIAGIGHDGVFKKIKNNNFFDAVADKKMLPYREYFLKDKTTQKIYGVPNNKIKNIINKAVTDVGDGFKKSILNITPETTEIPTIDSVPGLAYIPELGVTLYRGGTHVSVSLYGKDYQKTADIMEYSGGSVWKNIMFKDGKYIGYKDNGSYPYNVVSLPYSFPDKPITRMETMEKPTFFVNYDARAATKYNIKQGDGDNHANWVNILNRDGFGSMMTLEVSNILSDSNSVELYAAINDTAGPYTISVWVNGEYKGTTDIIPSEAVVGTTYPAMKAATIYNVKEGDIIAYSLNSWRGSQYIYNATAYNGAVPGSVAYLKLNNVGRFNSIYDYESYITTRIGETEYMKPTKLIVVDDPDKSIYNSYRAKFLENKQTPKNATVNLVHPNAVIDYSLLNHDNRRYIDADAAEIVNTRIYDFMGGLMSTGGYQNGVWMNHVCYAPINSGYVHGTMGVMRLGFNFTGKTLRIYMSNLGYPTSVFIDGYYMGKISAPTGTWVGTTKECVFDISNLPDGEHTVYLVQTYNANNTNYYFTFAGFEVDATSVLSPALMDKNPNPYFNQYIPFSVQNKITNKELHDIINSIKYSPKYNNKNFTVELEQLTNSINLSTDILQVYSDISNVNKKLEWYPTVKSDSVNYLLNNANITSNVISGITKKAMFNFTGTYICIRGTMYFGSCFYVVLDGELLPPMKYSKLLGVANTPIVALTNLDDKEHSIMVYSHAGSFGSQHNNWVIFSSFDVDTSKEIKPFNFHIGRSLTCTPVYTKEGSPITAKTTPTAEEQRIDIATNENVLVESMYYQPHIYKYGDIKFTVTGTDRLSIIATSHWVYWYMLDCIITINGENYYAEMYQNNSASTANTDLAEIIKFTNLDPLKTYSVVIKPICHVPHSTEGMRFISVTHIDINKSGSVIEFTDNSISPIEISGINDNNTAFSMDKYQLNYAYNKMLQEGRDVQVIELSYDSDLSSKLLTKKLSSKSFMLVSNTKMNIRSLLIRNLIHNISGDNSSITLQLSRDNLNWFTVVNGTEISTTFKTGNFMSVLDTSQIPDESLYFNLKIDSDATLYVDELVRSNTRKYVNNDEGKLDTIVTVDTQNNRIYGHGISAEAIAYKVDESNKIVKELMSVLVDGNTLMGVANTANSGVITIGNNESNVYRKYITQKIDNTSDMYMVTVVPESSSDIFSDVTADVKGEGSFKEINVPVNTFMEVKLPNFTSISKPDFLYVENNRLKGVPEIIGAYTVEVYLVTGAKAVLSINVQDMNRIY